MSNQTLHQQPFGELDKLRSSILQMMKLKVENPDAKLSDQAFLNDDGSFVDFRTFNNQNLKSILKIKDQRRKF